MNLTWDLLLVHALLSPLYLWLGICRHELSHAFMAWGRGFYVTSIKVWPHVHEGRFYWGRVSWEGCGSARDVFVAPYAIGAVSMCVWIGLEFLVDWQSAGWWSFTAILLAISPGADILWNAGKWVFKGTGDLAELEE